MKIPSDRTRWIKFEPADWLRDRPLHQCSLAARGLWMDLLCIAASPGMASEHFGYVVNVALTGARPMTLDDIAWEVRSTPANIEPALKELEDAGVFSRSEDGAIYSRRMIKDRAIYMRQSENGRKGWADDQSGTPVANGTKQRVAKNNPLTQGRKIESESDREKNQNQTREGVKIDKDQIFDRVCALAKIDMAKLHKHPGWMNFPSVLLSWVSAKCDPDRDVWPTMERLLLTASNFPSSPNYFTKAVLEARDKRLALTSASDSVIEWKSRWTYGRDRVFKLDEAAVKSLITIWTRGSWGPWEICGRMPTDPQCDLPEPIKAQLLAIRSEPGKWIDNPPEGYA